MPDRVAAIGNRPAARAARRSGAAQANCAGMQPDAQVGERVAYGRQLFTRPAESPGELVYAIGFVQRHTEIAQLED